MNVLIATHGRPLLLRLTLDSLSAASTPSVVSRIVLVENGGDFGARGIVAEHVLRDLVTFASVSRANKSVALNEGLRLCDDGLIFMTDDDVIVSEQALSAYHVAASERGPGWFLGGPTKAHFEIEPDEALRSMLPASARGWTSENNLLTDREFFLGFNWAAYRSDLVAVGGFNPHFGPGSDTGATGQESEMQRRLRKILGAKGYYVRQALVSHFVSRTACSEEWLLSRARRHGVEGGMRSAESDPKGVGRSIVQMEIRSRLRGAIEILLFNKAHRLRYKRNQAWLRGFKHGAALIRSGSLTPGPFVQLGNGRDSGAQPKTHLAE